MKEKYEISVAGTEMTVVTDESEDYVNRLVQTLDRRITEMVLVKNRCTKIEALTLCAMDYLDMALKLKAELEAVKDELEAETLDELLNSHYNGLLDQWYEEAEIVLYLENFAPQTEG